MAPPPWPPLARPAAPCPVGSETATAASGSQRRVGRRGGGGGAQLPASTARRWLLPVVVLIAAAAGLEALRRHCAALPLSSAALPPPSSRPPPQATASRTPARTAADAARGAAAASPALRSASRREVVAIACTSAAGGAWALGLDDALAEELNPIIADARRAAQETSTDFFNPNTYKKSTQNYNFTNIAGYLPTVYLAKRAFQTILVQLESPKINTSDPVTFALLREQNRLEPVKKLRKEALRTKYWLQDKKQDKNFGEREWERLRSVIDDQDAQCYVLSKIEGKQIKKSALKVTKKNTQAVIDAIDDILELLPEDVQKAAQARADARTIPVIRLPINGRYEPKRRKGNYTNITRVRTIDEALVASQGLDNRAAEAPTPAASAAPGKAAAPTSDAAGATTNTSVAEASAPASDAASEEATKTSVEEDKVVEAAMASSGS